MGPMNDSRMLIAQMVTDISCQAARLDDLRLLLFLTWLGAHSRKMKTIADAHVPTEMQMPTKIPRQWQADIEEQFKISLGAWLVSLPLSGLLWEYHLILDEIDWWRNLDDCQLAAILKPEGE